MRLPTDRAPRAQTGPALAPLHAFVNAVNVVGFGASAVVRNLLSELSRASALTLTAAVPDLPMYRTLDVGPNVRMQFWPRAADGLNNVSRLRQLHLDLPRAVAAARPDICLTLGDVGPIRLPCPHTTFVHLAHLAYPREYLAGHDAWSPLKRRYLEWHFQHSVRNGTRVIVQTPLMAARIARRYGIAPDAVYCIAQPAPVAALAPGEVIRGLPAIAEVGRPTRLLFIAAMVEHKNHAILPALVRELRARGLDRSVAIFVTLDADAAARVIPAEDRDVVHNLGSLTAEQVRAAYIASSALFLPTLVESYGLPYLEALALGRPILTSDRDFARWMCGDLALYFDPLDPASIADTIARHAHEPVPADHAQRAAARLREFPADWREVARRFEEVLREVARVG